MTLASFTFQLGDPVAAGDQNEIPDRVIVRRE